MNTPTFGNRGSQYLHVAVLEGLISKLQLRVFSATANGEEAGFFEQKLIELATVVRTMPKTYEQDGKGDRAIAYLHYYVGGFDWWITEIDGGAAEDGPGDYQRQAFGLVRNGSYFELGYISIPEVVATGAEIDLHWLPKTLAAIRAEFAGRSDDADGPA